MYCYDHTGLLIEHEAQPHLIPAKVILQPNDNIDLIISHFEQLLEDAGERFAAEERARFHSRETRYDSDLEPPAFPLIISSSTRRNQAKPIVVLPDGRRTERLDANRVQTLCGVQEIIPFELVRQMSAKRTGTRLCKRCYGRHLPEGRHHSTSLPPVHEPIPCQKCHADVRSSSYWDGPDTLVCIHCGHRINRPNSITPVSISYLDSACLTEDEQQANERAIATAEALLDSPVGFEQEDSNDLLDFEEDAEDPDEGTIQGTELDSDGPSPYDEAITTTDISVTIPFNKSELEEIHAILNQPFIKASGHADSPLIRELLARTEARLDHQTHDLDFSRLFAEVVGEELSELGDIIHAPAIALFRLTYSPLRQGLLDYAIQGLDHPEQRMAMWAAAGRFVESSDIPWLRDYRAGIDPESIPQERIAQKAYWQNVRAKRKQELKPLLEWLHSLHGEDLAILAGDPDTSHPFLQQPDPETFQSTDRFLHPLIGALGNKLQRFRQKDSGCRILADDFGLEVQTLETIARQSGQLMPYQAGSNTVMT